jgi:tetratricopeptide (TPR) repeat protein
MNPMKNEMETQVARSRTVRRPRSPVASPVAAAVLGGVLAALVTAAPLARAQEPAPPQGTPPAPAAPSAPATATTDGAKPSAPKTTPARKPNRAVPLDLNVLLEKVARYPDNPYLLNEVGNQLLLHGRRKDAESHFQRSVKLDPEFAAGWNNLGVARMTLDKKTEAASAYRKALKIQPNYALAWYNLGVVLDRQNHYEESLKAYETAFVLDPDLLDVKKNPQVVTNKRIAAVMSQTYIDRGGTVVFPLESFYPEQ